MKRWTGLAAVMMGLALVKGPAGSADEFEYDISLRRMTLYQGGLALAGTGDMAVKSDRIVAVSMPRAGPAGSASSPTSIRTPRAAPP